MMQSQKDEANDKHVNPIAERKTNLLAFIASCQTKEGSFITEYLQPFYHPGKGWMEYVSTPFVPVNVLIPLLYVEDKQARSILHKGGQFLNKIKWPFGLWGFLSYNSDYFVPLDTDDTALCSFVLEQLGYKMTNKRILEALQTRTNHYYLWLLPLRKWLLRRPLLYFYLRWLLYRASRRKALMDNAIQTMDAEFGVSANILMYLGHTGRTSGAIHQLIKEMQTPDCVEVNYYPHKVVAWYLYARAHSYGNIDELKSTNSQLRDAILRTRDKLISHDNNLLRVYLANTVLLMGFRGPEMNNIVDDAWQEYTNMFQPYPFFNSNSYTDADPATGIHNTYFGSRALSAAVYVEYLSLLSKSEHQAHVLQ